MSGHYFSCGFKSAYFVCYKLVFKRIIVVNSKFQSEFNFQSNFMLSKWLSYNFFLSLNYKNQKEFLTVLTLVKILNCLLQIDGLKKQYSLSPTCLKEIIFYIYFIPNTEWKSIDWWWKGRSSMAMEIWNFIRSPSEKKIMAIVLMFLQLKKL